MRRGKRAVGVLTTILLLASTVLSVPAAAAPGGPGIDPMGTSPARPGPRPTDAAETRTVTLVTGDKVTVTPHGASVDPGPGRAKIRFLTSKVDGHLRVLPSDVLPMLRAGSVDARLFDVTTLIRFGYDDRRGDLPLIVTGPAAGARAATAGVTDVRALPGGTAMRVAKKELGPLWQGMRANVAARAGSPSKIWLDGVRKPLLTQSVPQIGAPAAWTAGHDGTGVTVAVLDSGIDAGHPDLAGRVAAAENFSTEETDAVDRHGHGTHVAATIASTGAAPGGYKGVAPGASLMAGKVCSDAVGCLDSWIIAGMQWAAEGGAKVVNISLGDYDSPEQDPVEAAIERITAEFGTLFVVAAGNDFDPGTINTPGSADAALTVGAVDKSDQPAVFSSKGPRVGDAGLKPDITAPGVDITAALSREAGGPPGQTHVSSSGTSMASPHVAGAAAILAQQHPSWTAAELKAALMGSAAPHPTAGVFEQGAGRVDVARAITQTVTSAPASVSFGQQEWPHTDDVPDTRTVTYRNAGTADVTLALSLAGDLPAGLFSLSATAVTVPAGGTASVSVTSDTRAAVPDGTYGGRVVATAGDVRVVTPFGVVKDIERYGVTLTLLDRSGRPTTNGEALAVNLVTGDTETLRASVETRLPRGRYVLLAIIDEGEVYTSLVDPSVTVDRASTVTFDARVGRPVSMTVPDADAVPILADTEFVVTGDGWSRSVGLLGNSYDGLLLGQPDPAERNPALTTVLHNQLVKGPLPTEGEPLPSPYSYYIAEVTPGHAPSGITRRFTERDLAKVEATYASQGVAAGGTLAFPHLSIGNSAWSALMPVTLPGKRTEYYTAHPLLSWVRELGEGADFMESVSRQFGLPVTFPVGRTTTERVNQAVFGPAFGEFERIARDGDALLVVPGTHSAAGPWTGRTRFTSGRVVVERDGRVVYEGEGSGAYVTGLPPEEAAFTVTVDVERGAPSRLSTRVSAEWRFRSGAMPQERAMPVSTVRFAPPLSDTNTAPAGRVWLVPVEIQRHPGSAAGRARTLTVEVSYDDGKTWRHAPVVRSGQHGLVILRHPAGAGFVSLRAQSTDTAANSVRQTVIRAYEVTA